MDLELILRALWRRRLQLMAWVLAFAVLVPLGAEILVSKKYSSSTDIAVFPAPDIDATIQSTYQLNPDRFVATQVAIISSRESAAAVAKALHLSTNTVGGMLSVAQVAKSDVIRVTATSTSAARSAAVAAQLSNNYVASVQASLARQYQSAINSADDQIKSLEAQIVDVNKQLAHIGANPSAPGSLQSQLGDLLSQQSALNTRRQQLVVDSQTAANSTQIVSNAAVSTLPVGLTKTKLVLYGGMFGFGIAVLIIALGAAPGKTLDDFDSTEEVDGVSVLGVFETEGGRILRRLHGPTKNQAREVRNIRIASEIRSIIRLKGPVVVLRVGREHFVKRATAQIVDLIHVGSDGSQRNPNEIPEAELIRDASLRTSAAFLENHPDYVLVVLGIDVATVSPTELLDVLGLLRSFGVEVIGLVGVR